MRVPVFILSFIFISLAQAGSGSVRNDLERQHDIVAIVKVDSINTEYRKAVNVVVERIIYKYGEVTVSKSPVDIKAGDQFILVESKIAPMPKESDEGLPRTIKVESVRSTSCYRFSDFKVGMKLRLFAKEIQKGFYKNSACTLTKAINEDT